MFKKWESKNLELIKILSILVIPTVLPKVFIDFI